MLKLLDKQEAAVGLKALIDQRSIDSAPASNLVERGTHPWKPDAVLTADPGEYVGLHQIHERQKPSLRIVHYENQPCFPQP
jgi:hypothetical protein